MKAIILAAGRGHRLGKLTADRPKCLLPFGEETIIGRQYRLLMNVGLAPEDIYIVAGYCAGLLEKVGGCIVLNKRFYNTDNAYSLGLALTSLPEDQEGVLIMDGDLIFEQSVLEELFHAPVDSILVQSQPCTEGGTGVVLDADRHILEIGKHLKQSECSFLSMMKLSYTAGKCLGAICMQPDNERNWYTVPLNRNLQQFPLKGLFTLGKVIGVNTFYDYIHAKDLFQIEACKIMVTGASGFLGKKLCSILERQYKVIGVSRSGSRNVDALDLLDTAQLQAFIELKKPNIIIHTVAIADPNACDQDHDTTYQVNVELTKKLCEICNNENIKLIFISTDYVFDGESDKPYQADSLREPKNYYGYSKMMAEDAVKALPESLIIRIPLLYGYNDSSDKGTFVTKLLTKLRTGSDPIYLDNQQTRYPVLIDEVSLAISEVLSERGIIQLSSDMPVTKYTWGKMIAESFGLHADRIKPTVTSNEEDSPRPPHVKMDTSRMEAYGIHMSNARDGVEILKKQMNCIFRLIYKSKPEEMLFDVNVGAFRYHVGRLMVATIPEEYLAKADCVVPVPNSGLYYAMGLASAAQKPYVQALVKILPEMRSFNIEANEKREELLGTKIVAIPELVVGKDILLVDEAIFTGTTLRVVCDILKACGTKSIHICIPTPVCYSRCQQYMQPDRAVLTEQTTPEHLAEYFRVNSVNFQSYERFSQEIDKIQAFMCKDCFNKSTV